MTKLNKRIRNERVRELFAADGDLSKRGDFEGDKKNPPKKIEKLEKEINKLAKECQLKNVAKLL